MSSRMGKQITVEIFGESHAPAIGMTLDGVPAGIRINEEKLHTFMARRAPGGRLATSRREADLPEQAGTLTLVKQYNYGKIKVSRYERGEEV